MTIESIGGDTKAVKEYSYKGETEVNEVLGKVIKRRKSYNIAFQVGGILSHKEIQ